jgi:hypothetical protein
VVLQLVQQLGRPWQLISTNLCIKDDLSGNQNVASEMQGHYALYLSTAVCMPCGESEMGYELCVRVARKASAPPRHRNSH